MDINIQWHSQRSVVWTTSKSLLCRSLDTDLTNSVMTPEGVESIPVVIDLMSLGLMKGKVVPQAHRS
jgi:hypothetical protein